MKFQKGRSGNPAGRPKGTKNGSGALREAIREELPSILRNLIELARGGDTQAAGVLLSRALPPLRPVSEATEIPGAGESLGERAEAISAAALSGAISPTTASELMSVLSGQARIVEIAELEQRIAALEERHGSTPTC